MIDPVFLGVGGAFRPDLFNTSACFQKDGTLYLLDCGGTVMGRLLKSGALESAERLTVLLTHLHADHAGGLGTLLEGFGTALENPFHIVWCDMSVACPARSFIRKKRSAGCWRYAGFRGSDMRFLAEKNMTTALFACGLSLFGIPRRFTPSA